MANKPVPVILQETQPHEAVNVTLQLVFAATNAPINFPHYRIAPGLVLTLRPINGAAVNTNPCKVAKYPEALSGSSALLLPAGSSVAVGYPVENTGDIWASGTAGDGLQVTIQGPQVG